MCASSLGLRATSIREVVPVSRLEGQYWKPGRRVLHDSARNLERPEPRQLRKVLGCAAVIGEALRDADARTEAREGGGHLLWPEASRPEACRIAADRSVDANVEWQRGEGLVAGGPDLSRGVAQEHEVMLSGGGIMDLGVGS